MYHFKYRAMLCCLCVNESNELASRAIVHRVKDVAVLLMNEKIVGLDDVERRVKVCNLVLDRVGINVDLQKLVEIHGNPPIKWYYSVLKVTHSSPLPAERLKRIPKIAADVRQHIALASLLHSILTAVLLPHCAYACLSCGNVACARLYRA